MIEWMDGLRIWTCDTTTVAWTYIIKPFQSPTQCCWSNLLTVITSRLFECEIYVRCEREVKEGEIDPRDKEPEH